MDSFAPFGWLRTIPRTVAIGALLLFGGAADAQTDDGKSTHETLVVKDIPVLWAAMVDML